MDDPDRLTLTGNKEISSLGPSFIRFTFQGSGRVPATDGSLCPAKTAGAFSFRLDGLARTVGWGSYRQAARDHLVAAFGVGEDRPVWMHAVLKICYVH